MKKWINLRSKADRDVVQSIKMEMRLDPSLFKNYYRDNGCHKILPDHKHGCVWACTRNNGHLGPHVSYNDNRKRINTIWFSHEA